MADTKKNMGFWRRVWNEIEPIVVELLLYGAIFTLVGLVRFFVDGSVPTQISRVIEVISYFMLIAVIGLFTLRTLLIVLIRSLASISSSIKLKTEIEKNLSETLDKSSFNPTQKELK